MKIIKMFRFCTWVCVCSLFIAANVKAETASRPNVLIIYFDDMGYGDMGANGASGANIPEDSKFLNPEVPTLTPNLDRFATESMRFTNGHSSDGVCSPSRYSLLTGRYSWRTSLKQAVTWGYSRTFMEAGRFTIGKMFQKHGYKTAMVGKWHIGMTFQSPEGNTVDLENDPDALTENKIDFSKEILDTPFHLGGFDYYFGTPASLDMPPYAWLESENEKVHVLYKGAIVDGDNVDFSQARIAKNSDLTEAEITQCRTRPGAQDPTFIFADYLQIQSRKVVDLIEEYENEDDRFFIYVPMPAPHSPHTVQQKFQGSAGWTYGDYVVQTDYYTGEILKALGDPNDPDSVAANTVVFISSDNGPENGAYARSLEVNHDANGPWAGRKRDNYEGGTRVPFMIRWPGKIEPDEVTHACWQGDFVAAMADVLGHELSAEEAPDSESFLPVLLGEKMPLNRRPAFIEHSSGGQFAIVDVSGEWKLIDGTGGGGNKTTCDADNQESLIKGERTGTPRQLFNLVQDPGERRNLLLDPTAAILAKEKELYTLLNSIRGDQEWGTDGSSYPGR